MKGKIKIKLAIAAAIVASLWIAIGVVDFARVFNFEQPFFCIPYNTMDDGGSGTYIGLGYSFEIEGNFMPEEPNPGVTEYKAKIFNIPVRSATRVY